MIEVADTSIDRDRAKSAIYRSSGVDEYLIVNINDRSVSRCPEMFRTQEQKEEAVGEVQHVPGVER